jgi:hypothetical protein
LLLFFKVALKVYWIVVGIVWDISIGIWGKYIIFTWSRYKGEKIKIILNMPSIVLFLQHLRWNSN